jgi:hypothetical protein
MKSDKGGHPKTPRRDIVYFNLGMPRTMRTRLMQAAVAETLASPTGTTISGNDLVRQFIIEGLERRKKTAAE